jgi:hypothetical protein
MLRRRSTATESRGNEGMSPTIRLPRLLLAAIAALVAAGPLATAADAHPRGPVVPDAIKVPAGNKLFLTGHAVGVQIYSCNGTAWSLTGPRANLYDDHGRLIITHFAGPTWQAKDGSQAKGTLVQPAPVDPTAIPWLLLSATSTPGPHGGGKLVGTTYIQRINTTGGLGSSAGTCGAENAGATAEVPYTADYYFWRKACAGHRPE